MARFLFAISYFTFFSLALIGQVEPSSGNDIINSFNQRKQHAHNSIFRNYPVKSIGPVVQGGRVSDLAINQENVLEYYVSYASGGVFKTNDNGITFLPIFDEQGALGIGDIALAPTNENILYVGTGEKNSSRSSYSGSGVYKTLNKGKNWRYLGLPEIHHTSRILVHPQNADIVWVAGLGALYSHNDGRGIYKSTDGGEHWEKTLYINDSTGIVDLIINPKNPDQLWAASWERTRSAWNFNGNGPGSAIYRSDDGGINWQRLSDGFPQNKWIGRIGVDLCMDQPNVLYALVDNQEESKTPKEKKEDELQPQTFLSITRPEFAALDTTQLNRYLKDNGFPDKYDSHSVKQDIKEGKYPPAALSEYIGNANKALFDTKIIGAELYRSNDFGDTWRKVNSYNLDGVYNTYGYYFGEVRVVPNNPEMVYIFGVPLLATEDGGNTFQRVDTIGNVHVDHQALWINPNNSNHLILGNDGGLYTSYDSGAHWLHLNNMPVGQFYSVNIDMEKPYNVYGGLQDNGVYMGSSKSIPNKTKFWEKVLGGDGMLVSADPRNNQLVYTGFQFGNYFRINRKNGAQVKISPKHDIGEPPLRYNWRAPLILSEHHADIIYIGSQKLFRSMDRGENWMAISDDLTRDLPQGNVPYSTITCVSESPLKFGLLYVGTDDGNVQLSMGGGDSWSLVSKDLPDLWVSSIYPSSHQEGQVYLGMNGYRLDDYKTYVYYSDNFGKDWQSIQGNLPQVVVNVIKQDLVNPNLLYLGTDHGAYVSLDHGKNWQLLTGIPNVAVYDLIVHPRDHELVIATHGRSMYTIDVEPWQSLTPEKLNSQVLVFDSEKITYSDSWGESKYPWSKPYIPSVSFKYYVGKSTEEIHVIITDQLGEKVAELSASGNKGFNNLSWDLKKKTKKKEIIYVAPGTYSISFRNEEFTDTSTLIIENKPHK